jgi:hypothetical protein
LAVENEWWEELWYYWLVTNDDHQNTKMATGLHDNNNKAEELALEKGAFVLFTV